jgi:hypothetical protein
MAKTATKKATLSTTAPTDEATPTGEKSCAYPSCSQRAGQTIGNTDVPACAHHAPTLEAQANDGAGIQHLIANYKG